MAAAPGTRAPALMGSPPPLRAGSARDLPARPSRSWIFPRLA